MTQIKNQVAQVLRYSEGIDTDVETNSLIDMWYNAKKSIIDAWGGKFIIELPGKVKFRLDKQEKERRLNRFILDAYHMSWNSMLEHFLSKNYANFYSNIVEEEFVLDDKVITKGTKIIKAFKHFGLRDEVLRTLQDQASRLIQEDCLTGTLCLSVHPLDYLSSSENTHNWRSCHSLDGAYRSGNLSYMLDNSTIICYIKSDGEYKLPNFPEEVLWNSKKWRLLVHINEDRTCGACGRSYPFHLQSAMEQCIDEVLKSLNCNPEDYSNESLTETKNGPRKREQLCGIYDNDHSTHYNDVLKSPYPHLHFWRNDIKGEFIPFGIGHKVKCIVCGEETLVEGNESMLCDTCWKEYANDQDWVLCEFCGTRTRLEDTDYVEGYGYVCVECAAEECVVCQQCNRLVTEDNAVYLPHIDTVVCRSCYNNRGGADY